MNIQGVGQQYTSLLSSVVNRNQGDAAPSKMDASQIFSKDDANTDGVLTIDETPLSEDMFSEADSDTDGQLTLEEMEDMLAMGARSDMAGMISSMRESGGPPPPDGPGKIDASSLIEEEDSDEDGTISSTETSLSEELFSLIDEDGDENITLDELEKALEAQQAEAKEESKSSNFKQTMGISAYREAISSFLSSLSVDQNGSNIDSLLETTA